MMAIMNSFMSNRGASQIERMRRLVCAFVVRKQESCGRIITYY